jgi:hypothetical protein
VTLKRIKYEQGTKHDAFLTLFLGEVKKRILNEKQRDDALFLYAGRTGTGKSTLLLWSYEIYTPRRILALVPRSQEEFAKALKIAKNTPIADRVVLYDEAEASKRESMTRWNKDLIRVYSKIRGKRILHGWCYPDSDMIDTKIVLNRVNGIFVTYEKSTEGIRHYYYYSQEDIRKFLEKFPKLLVDLLVEHGPKYASFQGYFTEYDGELRDAYFARKEEGMDEEIDKFSDKYSGKPSDFLGITHIARSLRISTRTVTRMLEYGISTGAFKREQVVNALGQYKLIADDVEVLKELLRQHEASKKFKVATIA